MNKIKHKSRLRRKQKYDQLRDLGFTSKEANRYKDYSDFKIEALCEQKRLSNLAIKSIAGDDK